MLHSMKLSAIGASCLRGRANNNPVHLILIALLGVLALPPDADAKTGYRVHPGSTELILPVEAKGGRIISVSANNRQRVQLKVERPSSTIEYSTKGRVTSRRIEADFGALGRIDVRLDLVRFGPGVFRQGHCKGHDPIEGEGTYRGTIEFSQEGGVPEVSTTRGRVYFERRFRQICKRRNPRYKPGPFPKLKRKIEEGELTVRGKGGGRTVRLDATFFAFRRNPAQSGGTLRATVYERREGVRITRWRGGFFDDSFAMSKRGTKPETVRVELPEPFAGFALYSRSPGSPPSWTGDLSVDLPGAEGIPLTGPGFSATLCRGKVGSCL
jgi:hypothetical protein